MAPGGTRRFAAVSRASTGTRGEEIPVGAKGCLCEILESTEGEDGICNVIVETAAACKVLSVQKEEMHRGPPLFIGNLEELDEEEEEHQEDDDEDGNDSEAVVLGEEGQLELLRERVQLLELLNAAMELEQARLEQRRLELTMLLSQRRLYQELIEMQSEVADLVGLSITPNTATNQYAHGSSVEQIRAAAQHRSTSHRRNPEGMGGASSSSEQWRHPPESRARGTSGLTQEMQNLRTRSGETSTTSHQPYHTMSATSNAAGNRARSGQGEAEIHGLLSLTRRSFETVTSSVANVLGATMHRNPSGAAEQEAPQRVRHSSRGGSGAANSQRGLTAADALRRRDVAAAARRTASGSVPASSASSGASVRGSHVRGRNSSGA